MKKVKSIYNLLAVLPLLASASLFPSCNIEKRIYTRGYYIHLPTQVKDNLVQPENTELSSNPRSTEEAKTDVIIEPVISVDEERPNTNFTIKATENRNGVDKIISNRSVKNVPTAQTSFRSDDEEEGAKKDVRGLILGSSGTVLGAALYGVFLSAGVISLANLFFILTPFAIIGMWIYALLLHDKYAQEALAASNGKKKERIYTQHKAFLLAGFLGIFGAHRFYLGYNRMGFLEMFTLGGFFILFFIDLIRIKAGKLKPLNGDYEKSTSTYTRSGKNKVKSRSLKLIRMAMLISITALLLFLWFAFFL